MPALVDGSDGSIEKSASVIATVSPDAVVLVEDSVDDSVEVSLDAAVVDSSSSPPQAANVSGIAISERGQDQELAGHG